ncbi:hypothetical protein UK23_16475 [Lentzea aerocolonigenes]|uniref:3-keto-disaccharide hydrolase domain-containing protein n=1 Tax=Lentzea aerocolonigenes TaxID=68170 RepID=A0A0F0H2Y2_LENAE|nr:hypothetical protein UK23_16475 [Lentzea aerocolonigenes]
MKATAGAGAVLLAGGTANAAAEERSVNAFTVSRVSLRQTVYKGRGAVEMTMPSSAYQDPAKEVLTDRDFMAWKDFDFHDGTIDAYVASKLAPDAPSYARGFIGISFRIDAEKRFENIYLRPVNSQVEDQVRRNHSIQYFAYPDFLFPKLRKEEPEKYESYVDIDVQEWIHMRIDVRGSQAKLFVNGAPRPSLVVNDLKLGPEQRGGVGFWIESGTVGYFSGLRVRRVGR